MTGLDTVLLIHGAWQGSWVWQKLEPLLNAEGLRTIAIDLPGNGSDDTPMEDVSLERYLDHIGEILKCEPGTCSVIGHSGGGVVATAVAERFAEKISRVAYIVGMMLPSGMAFADLLNEMKAAENNLTGIGDYLTWSEDRVVCIVPPEAGADIFLNHLPREEALVLAQNLTPQANGGRAISCDWTPDRFGNMSRLYIECTEDRSVLLPVQRRMQELVPGAERVTLNSDHVPHASQPEELARVLTPFLSRLS